MICQKQWIDKMACLETPSAYGGFAPRVYFLQTGNGFLVTELAHYTEGFRVEAC